jgi:hypothetical protein
MNELLTKGMNTADSNGSGSREWYWGIFAAKRQPIRQLAQELGVQIHFGEAIGPGDLYLAMRNRPPQLLRCRSLGDGWVVPDTMEYPFNTTDCVKVSE